MNLQSALPLGLSMLLFVGGCAGNGSAADPAAPSRASSAAIAAAVADPRRPAADVARDAGRKPQALLEFAGLAPGMNLLDMFAGGGYYTELAAYVVGPQGKVVAYNNTGYAMVAAKQIASRYADGRLADVEQLTSENNETQLPAATFDVVLFVLSYHDVYYLDGERGWTLIDRPRLLKEVFDSVRSGGKVVVVDHVAQAAMPPEQVRQLHRIDPALVKADFQAAGFRFDAESDVLRNPDDDFNVVAMAPHVRGKTDRAVLRFVKP